MAILHGVEATPAERAAYLRHASAMRRRRTATRVRADGGRRGGRGGRPEESVSLSPGAASPQLGAAEEFVLTVSSEGFGKRTSAYDYRRTGRGGQGLIAHDLSKRGGRLVASFPVEEQPTRSCWSPTRAS